MNTFFKAILISTVLFSINVNAFDLSSISQKDASAGIKDALKQGADYAVSVLGKKNGFLVNDKVRIPLPDGIKQAESILKMVGLDGELKKIETNLNNSAELAVATAKPILINSINKMSLNDVKEILTGGDDSVTSYFRKSTSADLQKQFLPIVKQKIAQLKIADQYKMIAEPAAKFGVIDRNAANLDDYVTAKAMDGLFLMIAEKEKAIRQNPAESGTAILKKIFGGLKK